MKSWVKRGPYDPNNLRKVFNCSLDKAGLRRIRIHDMRHTFASILLAQGEPPPYVRDQLVIIQFR